MYEHEQLDLGQAGQLDHPPVENTVGEQERPGLLAKEPEPLPGGEPRIYKAGSERSVFRTQGEPNAAVYGRGVCRD